MRGEAGATIQFNFECKISLFQQITATFFQIWVWNFQRTSSELTCQSICERTSLLWLRDRRWWVETLLSFYLSNSSSQQTFQFAIRSWHIFAILAKSNLTWCVCVGEWISIHSSFVLGQQLLSCQFSPTRLCISLPSHQIRSRHVKTDSKKKICIWPMVPKWLTYLGVKIKGFQPTKTSWHKTYKLWDHSHQIPWFSYNCFFWSTALGHIRKLASKTLKKRIDF